MCWSNLTLSPIATRQGVIRKEEARSVSTRLYCWRGQWLLVSRTTRLIEVHYWIFGCRRIELVICATVFSTYYLLNRDYDNDQVRPADKVFSLEPAQWEVWKIGPALASCASTQLAGHRHCNQCIKIIGFIARLEDVRKWPEDIGRWPPEHVCPKTKRNQSWNKAKHLYQLLF